MKLLIFTQVVDKRDDVLGFMHGWICEFAKHVESLVVVGLRVGAHDFPPNVRVISLGKERGTSRLGYLYQFFSIIWKERTAYDAVFVHMTHVYVVLGGIFWRMMKKKIGLWYAHGSAPNTFSVRVAEFFSDIVFTSTKEGFSLPSQKVEVIGQGIDTALMGPAQKVEDGTFRILSVGRISKIKDYETLINATSIVQKEQKNIEVIIVGGPLTESDRVYQEQLVAMVKEKHLEHVIHFVGAVSHDAIHPYFSSVDLLVNCSRTASLDKAILEAMSAERMVLTSNRSLSVVLEAVGDMCLFSEGDVKGCADKIISVIRMDIKKRSVIEKSLRNIVIQQHSLASLVGKIIARLHVSGGQVVKN